MKNRSMMTRRRRNLNSNMDNTTKISYQINNNNIIITKTKKYKTKNVIKVKEMSIREFRNNTISENEKTCTKKTIKIIKRKKKDKI